MKAWTSEPEQFPRRHIFFILDQWVGGLVLNEGILMLVETLSRNFPTGNTGEGTINTYRAHGACKPSRGGIGAKDWYELLVSYSEKSRQEGRALTILEWNNPTTDLIYFL
jgi:hypothetical protein